MTDMSIQLTGPIVKDKLWYRLSYERLDQEDPVNIVSVAAGNYPNPVLIADVTTSTTHKTLIGPRGGFILCRSD